MMLLPIYDYFFHRRKILTALFNIGQLLLSLAIASFIWFRVGSDKGLSILAPDIILLALMTLIIFSLINHLLTNIVIVLATRKPFFQTGLLNKTALYNESAIITLGLSMAALWTLYPLLAVFSTVPVVILFLSLITLSKKESALKIRQAELASLNDLALEISAELDMKKLVQAIVCIASKSVQASAALLALDDHNPRHMEIYATHGFDDKKEQPKWFSLPFEDVVCEKDLCISHTVPGDMFPESPQERWTGYMALSISILKEKKSILCVFSGMERKSFDSSDAEKLKNLGKFIEIALSNASLYENLKSAQQCLIQSEKLSAVGMLISGVAHELNSPLTSIIGYSDLMYAQAKEESLKKKLEKIASEAQRAAKIVQNLLTFARESKADKKPMNANALIEKVLEMKSYSFRSSKIRVIREFFPQLNDTLADSNQIHQAILNILNNAEHALESKAGKKIIVIRTYEKDRWIYIKISNNGPPIPEENLKKIFLPFFTTKEIGRGTGLGLSICYGIIKEHKGKFAVENEREDGVTFTIELPAILPQEEYKSFHRTPSALLEQMKEVKGKKMLLVEDEDLIRGFISEFLSKYHMKLETACNGLEAIDKLKKDNYDLIMVDIKMPGLNGMEFYQTLKKENPSLLDKIIFMTGDGANKETRRFIQSCLRPCLAKPFTSEDLLNIISEFFLPASV